MKYKLINAESRRIYANSDILESDIDYVLNNIDTCVEFLERYENGTLEEWLYEIDDTRELLDRSDDEIHQRQADEYGKQRRVTDAC